MPTPANAALCFATTHSGKFNTLKTLLAHAPVQVEAHALDILEPQLSKVADVAVYKAKTAYAQLGNPCLAEDSGLFIDALGGMPGVMAKQVIDDIGTQALLDMMRPERPRTCRWESATAFYDGTVCQVFYHPGEVGTLTHTLDPPSQLPMVKGDFWRAFIPPGYTQTLASMDEATYTRWLAGSGGHGTLRLFAQWYVSEYLKSD